MNNEFELGINLAENLAGGVFVAVACMLMFCHVLCVLAYHVLCVLAYLMFFACWRMCTHVIACVYATVCATVRATVVCVRV